MVTNTRNIPIGPSRCIPAVGFGTFMIAPDAATDAVLAAIECGYRHVDTAQVYNNEAAVGEALRQVLAKKALSRSDLFITTKLWPGAAAWGEHAKNEAQTVAEFHASLDRLGLDYLDLYLIHSPHGGEERLAQWRALVSLKKAGLVRSIGVSNYSREHLEEIRSAGLPAPDANQIELHPWSQKPELVAYMRANGIAPIAYSSLAPLGNWRQGQSSAKTEDMRQEPPVFAEMAKKYGVTEAQLLLRWGVQTGYAVLPKTLSPERMRENLDLFSFSVDERDMESIRGMDRGGGLAWSVGDPTLVE
jgi:2,5-diketo-D-gluconate reductase A